MKRILLSLAAVSALAVQASAVLDLSFTVPANKTLTLSQFGSGTVSGTITGVTTDLATFSFAPLTGFTFTLANDGTVNTLGYYLSQNLPSTDFSGLIGTITATGTPGTYNTVGTVSTAAGGVGNTDGENLQVQVTPEPASLAALGVGALALLRRRKRA